VIKKSENELKECRQQLTELKNELRFQKDENEETKMKYQENIK
jgi:hypothetical protein